MLETERTERPTIQALSLPGSFHPTRLGRYEIESVIGVGMMGIVYGARDPVLARPVALKILRPDIPMRADERRQMELRFLREASLAAALSHPSIVAVYDVGRDAPTDTPFIALEYLEGRTLAEVMGPPLLDWRDSVRLTARLALALHHAHRHGIVHRDVKPSNVMVMRSGEPKILDFGIARASATDLTGAGEAWGTPSYMSPEQASAGAVDGRSDLFSLGSLLYELLTGVRAFGAASVTEVMARVLREEPPLPAASNPALPADVDVVLARALSKSREQRYPDGLTFAEDLEDLLEGRPVRARRGLRGTTDAPVRAMHSTPVAVCHAASCTLTTRVSRSHRRGSLSGLLMGAALAAVVMYVRTRPEPGAVAADTLATIPAAVVALPAASVSGPAEPTVPADLGLFAPPTTTLPPAPRPSHEPTPAPVVEPPRDPADPARIASVLPATVLPVEEPARIALSVEHGFKEGRLKVFVDDALVLDRALSGSRTKALLFLKRRKGSFAEVLDVTPGERRLRIEAVADDGETRSGQLRAVLKSDETRLLEIKLGGKVELDWKS